MANEEQVALFPEVSVPSWLNIGELQYFYTKSMPDRSTPEFMDYAAEVTELMSKADTPISEVMGEVIQMRHILFHPVRINIGEDKETGLPLYQEAVRTVILDADGMTYECVSDGAATGLSTIVQLFGPPEKWDKPIPIIVKQVNTRKGFRTFNIVVYRDKPKAKK